MSEMPKAYDPKSAEERWRREWKGRFTANPSSKKPAYTIVLPPPNVTGVLHMGHALVDTLQDILIRYKRMSGFEVLWVPGTDHAGIATQTVVERHLMKTTGKRRKDFSREEFLKHVWEWKERSRDTIVDQIKMVGCSLDFSRERFTMDEGCSRAVRTVFKKMYDDGLIYLGDYLVNWDPVSQTALADDEVEYEENEGHLWHFKYPLEDGSGHICIATTRPETMLGDVAVAVAPGDERYQSVIGKKLRLPLVDRLIPIIADHYVDPAFGTGAVKITPAHDPNDYAIGLRHDLEMINMMTPDGHVNDIGGEFAGLSMPEARAQIVKRFKELGLLEKVTPHKNRIGYSYRSKAEIQPYLSKQWFVKMEGFKEPLKEAIKKGDVKLFPDWDKTYFHWIDNLRDWCISRQLWWGHRIPIWYKKSDRTEMICYDGEGVPPEVAKEPDLWEQDEDVLDTWFSSALWPFSTLGWPDKTPDLEKFYPNSTLITGHDILFFWVARMILMGKYVMDEFPFPETFVHGLIYGKSYWREGEKGAIHYVSPEERLKYDLGEPLPKEVRSKWEKMSKSKGNVIDPLEIIETYGTDAMRMALTSAVTHARQIDLDRRRFEEFKNFANKVWNGARFALMNLSDLSKEQLTKGLSPDLYTIEDRWILSRLMRAISGMNEHLNSYAFDKAATLAYTFYWDELCAYYLELIKPYLFGKVGTKEERENKQKILLTVLVHALLLLHPMAPFITEEIFAKIKELLGPLPSDAKNFVVRALSADLCALSLFPTEVDENLLSDEVEETFRPLPRVDSRHAQHSRRDGTTAPSAC